MIGKSIRGFRHLSRVVGNFEVRDIIVRFEIHGYSIGKVIKVNEDFIIFNDSCNGNRKGIDIVEKYACNNELKETILKLSHRYVYAYIYTPTAKNSQAYKIYEIILLPNSFHDDYEKFCGENKKLFAQFNRKFYVTNETPQVKILYSFSNGSKNFLQWAVNTWLGNNTSFSVFKTILQWNDNYGQLVKKLSKGTITAYTSKDSVYKLLEEMRALSKEKRINDVINTFNTAQKKLIRGNENDNKVKQALVKFSNFSEQKRINFIRKVSSINDYNELVRQLKIVTSIHFDWNKHDFMDYLKNVENLQYSLVYDNGDIVLVEVKDFDTIKRLAKMTNWCISKNKTYWNQYTKNDAVSQYMLFNFSKKEDDDFSIVGFTSKRNNGITHAHSFTNHNIMSSTDINYASKKMSSFLAKSASNIFSLLDSFDIDISLVVKFDKPKYKWDKQSVINYLYEFVDKDNVYTLCDNGDKLVLLIQDSRIRHFLGQSYIDNFGNQYINCKHMLFFDFSMNQAKPNKLRYAMIKYGYEKEDSCIGLFNERAEKIHRDCDEILYEFGLPYNTIRRPNDKYKRFCNALETYNLNTVCDMLKADSKIMAKSISNGSLDKGVLNNLIKDSVTSVLSFDYLDLMYSLYPSLESAIGKSLIINLADYMLCSALDSHCILNEDERTNKKFNLLSKNELNEFYGKQISNETKVKKIICMLTIQKIIEREQPSTVSSILCKLIETLYDYSSDGGSFSEWLVNLSIEKCDFEEEFKKESRTCKYAFIYITTHFDGNIANKILSKMRKGSRAYNCLMDIVTIKKDKQAIEPSETYANSIARD